jgi:hypothetical protein
MLPRKGSASSYNEVIHPPEAAEAPSIAIIARGNLEDGTEFRFNVARAGFQSVCCASDHPAQHVNIEFISIPEPTCIALLLLGLVGLAGYRGRRCLR